MKATLTRTTLRHRDGQDSVGADSYDFALAVWADDGGAIRSRVTGQSERMRRYATRRRKRLDVHARSFRSLL